MSKFVKEGEMEGISAGVHVGIPVRTRMALEAFQMAGKILNGAIQDDMKDLVKGRKRKGQGSEVDKRRMEAVFILSKCLEQHYEDARRKEKEWRARWEGVVEIGKASQGKVDGVGK